MHRLATVHARERERQGKKGGGIRKKKEGEEKEGLHSAPCKYFMAPAGI